MVLTKISLGSVNQEDVALNSHAQAREKCAVCEIEIIKVKAVKCDWIELHLVKYFAMGSDENSIQCLDSIDAWSDHAHRGGN